MKSILSWSYGMIQTEAQQYGKLTVDVFCPNVLEKRSVLFVLIFKLFSIFTSYVLQTN